MIHPKYKEMWHETGYYPGNFTADTVNTEGEENSEFGIRNTEEVSAEIYRGGTIFARTTIRYLTYT